MTSPYTITRPALVLFLAAILALTACAPRPMAESPVAADDCLSTAWPQDRADLKPDPAPRYGRLDNGFRYVIMHNREPSDRVGIYLDVQSGSLHESDEERGLAHFLEHMLFNGTSNFSPGELVEYFQSLGMHFGADTNAHTGYDETVYNILLPTGDRKSVDDGLLVMADYARGALLAEDEVARERGVIFAEKLARDSVEYRIQKNRFAFLFSNTLIAKREIIGTDATLAAADHARLKGYYDAWYRPENMILVLVGDTDPDQAEELIRARFAALSAAAPSRPCPEIGRLADQGTRVLYQHEPELGYTEVSIDTQWNEDPAPDSLAAQVRALEDYVAMQILDHRLEKLVSSADSALTEVNLSNGRFLGRIGYASLGGLARGDDWRAALNVLNQALRQALAFGYQEPELERVKRELRTHLDSQVETAASRDSRELAEGIIQVLNNGEVYLSPVQEREVYGPRIAAMTLEQIDAAMRRIWSHEARLVQVATDKAIAGKGEPEAMIGEAFAASERAGLTAPELVGTAIFPYLDPPAGAAAVVDREAFPAVGVERLRFSSGLVLNLKPTEFEKNKLRFALHFGNGWLGEPRPGMALLAESVQQESGLGALDQDELDQALAGHDVEVEFHVREESFSLEGSALAGELETALRLLQARLVDPALRPEAFDLARRRFGQMYDAMAASVEGMMQLEGERFLAGGNPRYGMASRAEVESVTLDELRTWLLPALAEAPLELSLVGDFDREAAVSLVGRYLAPLVRGVRVELKGEAVSFPKNRTMELGVRSEIDKALLVLAWPTDDFWDISRTRRLHVLAALLDDRLRIEIRERLGAVYSPAVYSLPSRVDPGHGTLNVRLTIAPERIDEVASATRAVAAALTATAPDKEELGRIAGPILTAIKDMMRTNAYWLRSALALSSRHPEQLEWPTSIQEDFGAVKGEEIREMAARYLGANQGAMVVIRPDQAP